MGITYLICLSQLILLSYSYSSSRLKNSLVISSYESFLDVVDTEAELEPTLNYVNSENEITEEDLDEAIPVYSSSMPYVHMGGDISNDGETNPQDIYQIAPSQNAEGLTWEDIEETDDLTEIVEGTDNPVAETLV